MHVCVDGRVTLLHTSAAPVSCILALDLVQCGGPAGVAVGDVDGCVSYFYEGRLLCEHALPLAITSMACFCDSNARPAVAAADTSGAVLLFSAHELAWRIRLQDVPQIRTPAPSVSAMASFIDLVSEPRCVLVLATGDETVACLNPKGRLVSLSEAPMAVTAMCNPSSHAQASVVAANVGSLTAHEESGSQGTSDGRGMLLAAKHEIYELSLLSESTFSSFCCVGAHVTAMAPLAKKKSAERQDIIVACSGLFNGTFIISHLCILQHVLPTVNGYGWPLAAQIEHETAETGEELLGSDMGQTLRLCVTLAFCGGEIYSVKETVSISKTTADRQS